MAKQILPIKGRFTRTLSKERAIDEWPANRVAQAPPILRTRARHPSEIFHKTRSGGGPMRLRANEFCPIHRSISCCGREFMSKPRVIRLGVQRIEVRVTPGDFGSSDPRPRCENC